MQQLSNGQIMSWYHSQILWIPHGAQNPTKRYLTESQILKLFSGRFVEIYEKVDGKLETEKIYNYNDDNNVTYFMKEDMTHKNTVHNHIMKYTNLPKNKRIFLDSITIDSYGDKRIQSMDVNNLLYARIDLLHKQLTIEEIYILLESFAKMSSHFGSPVIEGIVIKNYDKQLMGKWINDEFEDKLNGGT